MAPLGPKEKKYLSTWEANLQPLMLMFLSLFHSTFHPSGFLMEVMSDLKPVARCPLWFHHAPIPSTQVHQFPLKINYESTMKSINNPLCTHSNGNGPLNNHGLVVWMRLFPLGLTWVEAHNGLRIGSVVLVAIIKYCCFDEIHTI